MTYLWSQARLRLPVDTVRSLREIKHANFACRPVKLGPASPGLYRGIEANVELSELHRRPGATFDFGTLCARRRSVSLLPLGSVTTVNLSSDWPHPSLRGSFLPVEHTITDQGFEARWQVLELNRSYGQVFQEDEVNEPALAQSAFGVSLFQPVDIYQRG